jgi:hypothetical protein
MSEILTPEIIKWRIEAVGDASLTRASLAWRLKEVCQSHG